MIEVGRNNIIIRNVDLKSEMYRQALYKYSVYDKVYHKYTFTAFYQHNNDLYFPSSITYQEIQKIFTKDDILINYANTAKAKTVAYNLKNQPRDELQEKAIKFLMKMKADKEDRQRFLSLSTGSGKTYVVINCISKFKKKPLVIVDSVDLAAQWKHEFLKHTDLQDSDIVILSGQESIDKEIKNKIGKVYIAIHRTLSNLLSTDMDGVNKLMNKLGIGIRIFDESHVEFGNICRINSLSNVEYTIYLTATPSRSAYTENTLYGRIFKNVQYFNGKDMDEEKYHTVVLYKMNSKPSFDDKFSVKTKYGFSASKWASYISGNGHEFFLEALYNIFDKFKLIERNKKIAIILPTIELIKSTKDDLLEKYKDLKIGTFIGEISKNKRIEEWENLVILTNDKIFDKAIDIPDLEILINFVPLSSLVKTEQIMGRLRNRKGYLSILIDVTDIGFDECIRQQKLRKRFYKKKAKKIIEFS